MNNKNVYIVKNKGKICFVEGNITNLDTVHLCKDCNTSINQCPKMKYSWKPIWVYDYITDGYQETIGKEIKYCLSPEEQLAEFDTGEYKEFSDVPLVGKKIGTVANKFIVEKCEKYTSMKTRKNVDEYTMKPKVKTYNSR